MTKIDDEMVERAMQTPCTSVDRIVGHYLNFSTVRNALEAALSPKPEPEIEVSEGMRQAGLQAGRDWWDGKLDGSMIAAQYRAMESTRLKEAAKKRTIVNGDWVDFELPKWRTRDGHLPGDAPSGAKSAPRGVSAAAPVKETGGAGRVHTHRRHGDAPNHPDGYGPPAFHRRNDDVNG